MNPNEKVSTTNRLPRAARNPEMRIPASNRISFMPNLIFKFYGA